jgi:hypothetical protein
MNTLTNAELRAYPGSTLTDQLRMHDSERLAPVVSEPAPAPLRPIPGLRKVVRRPLTVGARVDLGRFPGRDRVERMANYLRSHFPLTESWTDEALRDCAARLITKTEIVG